MANAAKIGIFITGGTGNTNPNASLGGARSTATGALLYGQTATPAAEMDGVTFQGAAGAVEGAGSVAYVASGQTLRWTPASGGSGPAIAVGAGGEFALPDSTGLQQLFVSVVDSALADEDQTRSVTVANDLRKVFDDIRGNEARVGKTEYRCLCVKNLGTVPYDDKVTNGRLVITKQTPGRDKIRIGLDPGSKNVTPAYGATRNVTEASWADGVATLNIGAGHPHTVRETIVVRNATPSGFNGVFLVTAITETTVSYALASDPGDYTSDATVVGETSPPADVTFVAAASEATGVAVPDLDAGDEVFFWEERTIVGIEPVLGAVTQDYENDASTVAFVGTWSNY